MNTAAKPPPVTITLDEFSDKLSPMLVKELRQGLRAKTFVILFLALQALLAVVLLVVAGSSDDSGPMVSKVIFFFFSLTALVAQPLRGIGALHNEIKGNTIDLMVLTRLGAWRIVLGKWVAIVSQTALLLTAIAPYLILRYFFGRMNLFAELLLLALIFLGSALFTALTVGLSAVPSILVRGLLPLFLGMYLGAGIFEITFDRNDLAEIIQFFTLQEKGTGWALLMALTFGGYFSWSALALGASMIAPMAENHSTSRRLVALGTVLLLGALAAGSKFEPETMAWLIVLVCAPAVVIALTEPTRLLPPIFRPFVRRGGLGKLAGRFLYPGWPAGTLFAGLLVAVAGIIVFGLHRLNAPGWLVHSLDVPAMITLVAGLGTLFMPALVIRLFGKGVKQSLSLYLLILAAIVAIAIAVPPVSNEITSRAYSAGKIPNHSFLWWFSWIPTVQIPFIAEIRKDHDYSFWYAGVPVPGPPNYTSLLLTGIATCSMYYLGLLFFAIRGFGAVREVEAEAEVKPAVES